MQAIITRKMHGRYDRAGTEGKILTREGRYQSEASLIRHAAMPMTRRGEAVRVEFFRGSIYGDAYKDILLYPDGRQEPFTGDMRENPPTRRIGEHVYDYESASKFLGDSSGKKLAHNTRIFRVINERMYLGQDAIHVSLHGHEIVTYYENGTIEVSNAGYKTRTTAQRINQLLPPGYRVVQRKYQWYLTTPSGDHAFERDIKFTTEDRGASYKANPGKFANTVEELLYVIDHDQTAGSVSEGTHWHGLVSGLTKPEAERLVKDHDIDLAEFRQDAKEYDWPLNAIIEEDGAGFIEVTTFKNNRDAIREWREVERFVEEGEEVEDEFDPNDKKRYGPEGPDARD